jgi:ATP-dependent DNA helicase DinG
MTKYAIVDLEATSGNLKENRMIQIGIVIVDNLEIVDSFSCEVNPGVEVTDYISELTGITNEQLRQSPHFRDVALQVSDYLEDAIFVAHNVKFDYQLLSKEFKSVGIDWLAPRIDTVELAELAFPTLEKYGVEALSRELGIAHDNPHQALSDAQATAMIFIEMIKKLSRLPLATLKEISRHATHMLYETHLAIQEAMRQTTGYHSQLDVIGNIAIQTSISEPELVPMAVKDRPQQAAFMQLIEENFEDKRPSFIEAPTGIGKTIGYTAALVGKRKRLIVATSTKALQDQYVKATRSYFAGQTGADWSVGKLLGAANYVKFEKLVRLLAKTGTGKHGELFKMRLLVWLAQTETGELSELSTLHTSDEMRHSVAHDGRLSETSTYYDYDFYRRAKLTSEHAAIMVINHSLMIDLLKSQSPLFEDAVMVVDEAQLLPQALEKSGHLIYQLGKTISDIDQYLPFSSSVIEQRRLENVRYRLHKLPEGMDALRDTLDKLDRPFLDGLKTFVNAPGYLYWRQAAELHATPMGIMDLQALMHEGVKVYFVSGHLKLGENKAIFPELFGFTDYTFDMVEDLSVYNQLVVTSRDALNPKQVSEDAYTQYLAIQLSKIWEMDYPTVVLFTSKDSLRQVSHWLTDMDVKHIAQDVHGDAKKVKEKFDRGHSNLLLGLGTFWEGMDFNKQTKLLVVFPRLPFASPEDIFERKIAGLYEKPFYDYSLPMAVLKMNQGLGRVKRRPDQKSVAIVLDGRLTQNGYGKAFIQSLQGPFEAVDTMDDVLNLSEQFLL